MQVLRGLAATARCAAAALAATLALSACNNSPWNQGDEGRNLVYSAMIENTPRHLDPTASYWSNDTAVTYQVYEPLYGYHYLKRPFTLVPKTAAEVVQPKYLDKDGRPLPDDVPGEQVAVSVYDVPIKPGILYAPHPAFARNAQGEYLYHQMRAGELGDKRSPWDFAERGTRELVAEDFVYAIKRHATTRITAPIYGVFAEYVQGLQEYGELIKREDAKLRQGLDPSSLDKPLLDFRRWPLEGAQALDKHTLRIKIRGKYPQWKYWMQMTFLAPVPWEADAFYAQPGMAERGLTLDVWPVGTGPYMMTEYAKDRRIVMEKNPNYRGEPYPCEGMPGDEEKGLLADCGKPTPFIDKIVLTVEREATPQRNKFRDGYYDLEVFERTDTGKSYLVEADDSDEVRAQYKAKGFDFEQYSDVNSYWISFNMLDPVIGWGETAEQRKRNRLLRQAITIAIDWEEYSKVFPKKAGETAQGLLPQGIPGSREGTPEGVNPVTHRWVDGRAVRRPIEDARRMMVEAGYPDGRDAKTGRPLVLNYDYYAPASPERKPEIDWVVKQFAKLGIQLEVRATDNNQFQDKVRKGKHQVFWLGWNADYPDAENFLFLFYGPNAKSVSDGENTANYISPEFDKLFAKLKNLDDGPEKQRVIDEMTRLLREDAPLTFGFYPYASAAVQGWIKNSKPAILVRDHARYLRLDAEQRASQVRRWNEPVLWPLAVLALLGGGAVWLARRALQRRERLDARGRLVDDAPAS
ncbi:ABC transporter substrate-binding protein [Roseateles sp.]|uniref:ABC transporter substrate-binding protein n=1 Tax=Roseateles sp. TaxID=1971397 RepID=UPI00391C1C38